MRFDDLLEKKEAKQLMLLRCIILQGGEVSIHLLAKELSLSKTSVETYIEDLSWIKELYKKDIVFSYDGSMVSLELSPNFSLEMIELFLYKHSVKYQIMDYLYHHFEYSTIALTQKIGISESTLFRKIKELNRSLKEFDLSIWQGKLIGEESQIRYFYYCFYWHLDNYSQKSLSNKQENLIEAVERGLGLSFSSDNKKRINLWLMIAKKRISYQAPIYKELRKRFKPYEKDSLFIDLKGIVLRVLGHYAVEIDEEEAMIHFSFLMSFQAMTLEGFYHYSIVRSKFTPVGMVDTFILESLISYYAPLKLSHQLERRVGYLLSRIHSRLYFFRGVMEVLSREYIIETEKEWSGHVIYPFVQQLFTSIENDFSGLNQEENGSLISYAKLQYLHLIALIDYEINRTVKVGVKLLLEDIYQEVTTKRLINEINSINGVVCSKYETQESYDLVISNKPLDKIKDKLYVFSELGTTYDVIHIKRLIREISSQKMTKETTVKKIKV